MSIFLAANKISDYATGQPLGNPFRENDEKLNWSESEIQRARRFIRAYKHGDDCEDPDKIDPHDWIEFPVRMLVDILNRYENQGG